MFYSELILFKWWVYKYKIYTFYKDAWTCRGDNSGTSCSLSPTMMMMVLFSLGPVQTLKLFLLHSQTKPQGRPRCAAKNTQHSTGASAWNVWGKPAEHTESNTSRSSAPPQWPFSCPQGQRSSPGPVAERGPPLDGFSNIPHEEKHTPLYERSSPINPGPTPSPSRPEAAFFNASSTSSSENGESSGSAAKWVEENVWWFVAISKSASLHQFQEFWNP